MQRALYPLKMHIRVCVRKAVGNTRVLRETPARLVFLCLDTVSRPRRSDQRPFYLSLSLYLSVRCHGLLRCANHWWVRVWLVVFLVSRRVADHRCGARRERPSTSSSPLAALKYQRTSMHAFIYRYRELYIVWQVLHSISTNWQNATAR